MMVVNVHHSFNQNHSRQKLAQFLAFVGGYKSKLIKKSCSFLQETLPQGSTKFSKLSSNNRLLIFQYKLLTHSQSFDQI